MCLKHTSSLFTIKSHKVLSPMRLFFHLVVISEDNILLITVAFRRLSRFLFNHGSCFLFSKNLHHSEESFPGTLSRRREGRKIEKYPREDTRVSCVCLCESVCVSVCITKGLSCTYDVRNVRQPRGNGQLLSRRYCRHSGWLFSCAHSMA